MKQGKPKITATKVFGGKTYQYSGIGHKSKRSAESYARALRRNRYLARVIGNKDIGWFVYTRKQR